MARRPSPESSQWALPLPVADGAGCFETPRKSVAFFCGNWRGCLQYIGILRVRDFLMGVGESLMRSEVSVPIRCIREITDIR